MEQATNNALNILYLTENGRGFDRWQAMFAKRHLNNLNNNLNTEITLNLINYQDITDIEQFDFAGIDVVLAWKPPRGIFPRLTHLKLIQSLGMGVDHLFACPDLPSEVPIARIIDQDMITQMEEYCLYGTLTAFRQFQRYQKQQQESFWQPLPRHRHSEFQIGILGLGELGLSVAKRLYQNGFTALRGWARSEKSIDFLKSFAGESTLDQFASELDLLICLLPLTPETQGILNQSLFAQLKQGAYLINPARGDHLIETDLLSAIDQGQLSGALLDVFSAEPLPENHPFWHSSELIITPHVAASTNPDTATTQVLENITRVIAGELPHNIINPQRGY